MEVQRTCEVTATPVEYVKARCTCERAGRCQPERGADEYGNSGKLLDRAIRGFEDLLFSNPLIAADFFLAIAYGSAPEVVRCSRNAVPALAGNGSTKQTKITI